MTRARNGAAQSAPPRTRAGATQPNSARRDKGLVRLGTIWITEEQKRRLEWIKAEDGYDYATIVGMHIDQEWEERQAAANVRRPSAP